MKTIEQKVIRYILDKNLLENNDSVLVALSGGPDSVFLLEFLIKYKRRFNIEVAVFHLNHNLRGKESETDVEFCKYLALKYNLPFYYSSKNIHLYAKRKAFSIEEAGREVRYKELSKIASSNRITKIATAHNADDNTETVLLNLIKGAGLKGLSGIPCRRDKIIRPLLSLSKKEILEYNKVNKLPFRTDSSNLENNYQRNFLRNTVIPLIKTKINPQFDTAVLKTSEIVKNASIFLDEHINNLVRKATRFKESKLIIDLTKLNLFNPGLFGEFIKSAVKNCFGEELDYINVTQLEILKSKQPGKKIELSKNYVAMRERDSIIILKNDLQNNLVGVTKIKIGERKKVGKKSISLSSSNGTKISLTKSTKREYIDAEKIQDGFLIRRWKEGDRFYPLGMRNSKKVSDFLNEQKIAPHKKKEQLVVTNSGNIVWIVGIRIDERYKISDKTSKYIELSLT